MSTSVKETLKTKIDSEQQALLSQTIESWLKERGLIPDGQSIEVTIRILPAKPQVAIVLADQNNERSIKDITAHMHRGVRVRMENAINHANITKLADLLSLSVEKMLKWRNIGKLTIVPFGEALEKAGLSDSPLAQDIRRYYGSDKMTLQTETSQAEIKPLENTDWEKMILSLEKVKRKHTKTQLKIIAALQKAGNELTDASTLFPSSVHGSWWRSHIHIVNLRWSSSNLPYRMRFIPTPTSKLKWAGKIQIGCYTAPQ